MLRISNRLVGIGVAGSVIASFALHSGSGALMHFASDIFEAEPPPEIVLVDAAIISEEEFEALSKPPKEPEKTEDPPPAVDPEPTTAPETKVESPPKETPVDTAALDPPPPDDTAAQPPTETPPAEPKSAPRVVSRAPDQPQLDPNASRDTSPDAAVRDALPRPTAATTTAALATPEARDVAPDLSRDSSRPDVDPCANVDRTREIPAEDPCNDQASREAPELKTFENRDRPAERSEPDIQPKAEEEPKVATVAPKTGPRLRRPSERRRRPAAAQPAAAPAEKPVDPLDAVLKKADRITRNASDRGAIDSSVVSDASDAPRLARGELARLRGALNGVWKRPPPNANPDELIVTLEVFLSRDGKITQRPRVMRPTGALNAMQHLAIEEAVQAVDRAAPFNFLPAQKYRRWRRMEITFDVGGAQVFGE